jgi:hypothetical protein
MIYLSITIISVTIMLCALAWHVFKQLNHRLRAMASDSNALALNTRLISSATHELATNFKPEELHWCLELNQRHALEHFNKYEIRGGKTGRHHIQVHLPPGDYDFSWSGNCICIEVLVGNQLIVDTDRYGVTKTAKSFSITPHFDPTLFTITTASKT